MPGIVVGVNGSPNSARALDWAMGHAAALQVPLTLIAVHEVPKSYWGGIPVTGPAEPSVLDTVRHAAEEMAQQSAAKLGEARPPAFQVRAVSGFIVRELVEASQKADLIVIGTPSGSHLSRLVMGSVSNEVLQHSACPVVIVPRHA
jgi:nucleotide-binding universal stress UspA family protein